MPTYENAKYYKAPYGNDIAGIEVLVNGVRTCVPLDPENTDYQNIMQLVAEGKLVIAPADA